MLLDRGHHRDTCVVKNVNVMAEFFLNVFLVFREMTSGRSTSRKTGRDDSCRIESICQHFYLLLSCHGWLFSSDLSSSKSIRLTK